MLAVTWEQISPAIYIALGSLLSFGGAYVMEGQREKRTKAERTREWQRDTLVELHEVLTEHYATGFDSIYGYTDWVNEGGEHHWEHEEAASPALLSRGASRDAFRLQASRILLLTARSRDADVVESCNNFVQHLRDARNETNHEEIYRISTDARSDFDGASTRIGELLRTTYA